MISSLKLSRFEVPGVATELLWAAGGGRDGLLLRHAPHHTCKGAQQHAYNTLCLAQGRLQSAGQTVPRSGMTRVIILQAVSWPILRPSIDQASLYVQ